MQQVAIELVDNILAIAYVRVDAVNFYTYVHTFIYVYICVYVCGGSTQGVTLARQGLPLKRCLSPFKVAYF
jgi:hypothetical protein